MAKPILLYTSIFSDTAINFTDQVLATPEDEKLKIWINTPGGSTNAGFAMLASVQEHKSDNEMTVTGNADSFGFFMLLFGDHNRAYDTSSFMIHRAASFWEDFMSEEELKDIEAVNKTIRKKLEARIDEDIFEKVTKKSFDDIFDMKTRLDVRLTARQAKKIGLIDEVVKLDVRKKAEIESRYFHDIAALSQPENTNSNINTNIKDMGLFKAIFGEKDPILLTKIGENQCLYSKLEKGSKIRAVGAEELAVSGIFEAENKQITVVENEITAVVEVDTKQKQIDALTETLAAMAISIAEIGKKPVVAPIVNDKDDKQIVELSKQVEAMKKVIADAKLSVSNPDLPKKEFDNNQVKPSAYKVQKEIDAIAAKKQATRDSKVKGGF